MSSTNSSCEPSSFSAALELVSSMWTNLGLPSIKSVNRLVASFRRKKTSSLNARWHRAVYFTLILPSWPGRCLRRCVGLGTLFFDIEVWQGYPWKGRNIRVQPETSARPPRLGPSEPRYGVYCCTYCPSEPICNLLENARSMSSMDLAMNDRGVGKDSQLIKEVETGNDQMCFDVFRHATCVSLIFPCS